MSKNYHVPEFIEKKLKNGALSGKEIEDYYISDSDTENISSANKTYSDAFDKLLKAGKIIIIGYNGGKGRNQNIGYQNLIFDLVKPHPSEIKFLIEDLEDREKFKKADQELKQLFYNKVREIESLNILKWKSLNKLVIIKEEFSDDEIICYDSIEEIYKKYKDYDDTDFISITNYEIKAKMEECWENLISIQKKYEKMKLFLLKISIEEDEDISLLNPKSIKGRCIISNKIESEKEFLEEIGINEPKNLNVDETNDSF